jgi:hypothetical protein
MVELALEFATIEHTAPQRTTSVARCKMSPQWMARADTRHGVSYQCLLHENVLVVPSGTDSGSL